MRIALTALLAFAAGVLLMLVLSHRPPLSPATHSPAATTAATQAGPAMPGSSGEPDDEKAGGDKPDDSALDNWPAQGPTPEQVVYTQPRLLREALAKLTPRVAGKPNLYLVSFAGDGGEDVFRNEAEYAAILFTSRFGATVHPLVLANNPDTLEQHPLATWSNLESSLDTLAGVMKPDEDILMLYLTSHGDQDHNLLVDLDPLPLDQIGAPDLADILNKHHFKWKVVVVNACYSGGFVPKLHGPGTLVLTAARTDRSSFGCGSDSDITYFGRAWLVDALNRTPDLIEAFKQASGEIGQWEKKDELTPSEPQIDIGNGIADQLALWRKSITPGPVVAFQPPHPAGLLKTAPAGQH
ncbi:Peptidase C13 family protein [Dyella sp. OK004]|uniref:C13 family peptidase n=1 Tax=Dyella sp. OK004 TaxID=1855292 RepID=UPI0008EBB62F|nr:C13 family peptidase [Dyella sp. OK004]SFS14987.1 Peptidase C13 family protein [Dyella sp. OK004]